MSDPILFQEKACPVCGGDVMSYESMEGGDFTDGEDAFCTDNCGWFGTVCVNEDGSACPSSASEIAPFIELIEELKAKAVSPLRSLAAQVLAINTANGWNVTKPEEWADTYKIPAILALIHSEVSEALEDFRKDNREHFNEEIADVVIRCLDLCGGMGIDIDTAISAKLEKNKARGFRHGGKKV